MARITVLIGGHLSTAPRPVKEATALAHAGHDVTVCGVWFDAELAARDEALLSGAPFAFRPALDVRGRDARGRARRFVARATGRAARALYQRSGHFSPLLFGYGVRELHAHARRLRADLTVAHSEGGLWIARELQQAGQRVGVDFEDWFSEDLLPEDRVHRPLERLRRLEGALARSCVYVTAASGAMANGLARAYDAPRPAVVYNVFPAPAPAPAPAADGAGRDRQSRALPSLHWFSQTLGPGRGLEQLMQALPRLTAEVEVHLRGALTPARRDWILGLVPARMRARVHLHATVAPDALPARIAEHDVGLALEIPTSANKDLTVSNKLFQYLQGGLAVVATATAGQREVLDRYPDAGAVVPPDDPAALAAALDRLAGDPDALRRARAGARRAAAAVTWEEQASRVVALADRALAAAPGAPVPVVPGDPVPLAAACAS